MKNARGPAKLASLCLCLGITIWTAGSILTPAQTVQTTGSASPVIDFPIAPDVDAFLEFTARRTSLHMDFPDGVRAYVVIPAAYGSTGNVLTLTRDAAAVPYLDSKYGVNVGLENARYPTFDRPLYLVFDFSRGECFRPLEAREPLSHFFLPTSGYFDPFLGARIKGTPFDRLLRDDVGVVMTVVDGSGKEGLYAFPAIATGCDGLVVAQISEHGSYVPVVFDRPNTSRILENQAIDAPLPLELLVQSRRHSLPLPAGAAVDLGSGQAGVSASRDIRLLTTDFLPYFAALKSESVPSYWRTKEGHDQVRNDARQDLIKYLVASFALSVDRPNEALTGSAIAALWDDRDGPATRARMMETLLGHLEYWQDYKKDGERIEYDLLAAALTLAGTEQLDGRFATHLARASSGSAREDSPMTARDYYGAGLIAAITGDRERAARHTARSRERFKEEISEMLKAHQTISSLYEAMVWGKMIGADRNPVRYRELFKQYQRARQRYLRCKARWRTPIELLDFNLRNFADQKAHMRTELLRRDCGVMPVPPIWRRENDKPERDDLKKTRDGLKRFNSDRGIPKKIGKVFGIKTPKTPFAVPQALFERLLSEIVNTWERAIEGLGQDPPRSDFQQFAEAADKPLPAQIFEGGYYGDDAKAFLTAFQHAGAVLEAAVVTFDRLGGAKQAGAAELAELQGIHLEMLKYDAGEAILEVFRLLDERRNFLVSIDPAEPNDRTAGGVSPEDIQILEELAELIRPLGQILVKSY